MTFLKGARSTVALFMSSPYTIRSWDTSLNRRSFGAIKEGGHIGPHLQNDEKETKNHDQSIFYYASSAPLSSCRSSAFDEFRSGERANHDVHLSRSLERGRQRSQRRYRHADQSV